MGNQKECWIVNKLKAWVLAGPTLVCKTIRYGFDSRPCLQFRDWIPLKFYPSFFFEYVVRDGRRLGPFIWSVHWTRVEDVVKYIWGSDGVWANQLSEEYNAPIIDESGNPFRFIRTVIYQQHDDIKRWKKEAVEAKKELSKFKREINAKPPGTERWIDDSGEVWAPLTWHQDGIGDWSIRYGENNVLVVKGAGWSIRYGRKTLKMLEDDYIKFGDEYFNPPGI